MKIELLILGLAPIVAYILWIYLKDRYEREPIMILGKYFILGVFISILGIILEELLMKINVFEGYSYILYVSFIVAGVIEEGLKAIVLIPNLLKEKNFNEKLDGIIYSIFLSLGFATIENLIYLLFENASLAFELGISRAIISVPAHIMFAITMGYYISKYKFSNTKGQKREYLIMAILSPIMLHGIFDFILMIGHRWSIVIFIIYIVFLWKVNLDKLNYYIKKSKQRFINSRKGRKRDD